MELVADLAEVSVKKKSDVTRSFHMNYVVFNFPKLFNTLDQLVTESIDNVPE